MIALTASCSAFPLGMVAGKLVATGLLVFCALFLLSFFPSHMHKNIMESQDTSWDGLGLWV